MTTNRIVFSQENWGTLAKEAQSMFYTQYIELAWRKDKIRLNMDHERYFQMEWQKKLAVFTARSGVSERLIGYSVFFLSNNMHYKDVKQASNDIIFLLPEFRKGRTGVRLIQFCEKELIQLGVQVISYHLKVWMNWGSILQRMGHDHTEHNFHKWVGA